MVAALCTLATERALRTELNDAARETPFWSCGVLSDTVAVWDASDTDPLEDVPSSLVARIFDFERFLSDCDPISIEKNSRLQQAENLVWSIARTMRSS